MSDTASQTVTEPTLHRFFADVGARLELAETSQRQQNRHEATGFNVFDLIEPDENRLSDILAMLLDPHEVHGQGDLFLRLLIEALGTGLSTERTKFAKVHREAPTYGIANNLRRLDVLVEAGDVVAIENKVSAPEQPEQVKDYLDHLRHCTKGRFASTLIYLTPDGAQPSTISPETVVQEFDANRLRCWSYGRELRQWLKTCQRQCEAPRISSFLSDFICHIEQALNWGSNEEEGKAVDEN